MYVKTLVIKSYRFMYETKNQFDFIVMKLPNKVKQETKCLLDCLTFTFINFKSFVNVLAFDWTAFREFS